MQDTLQVGSDMLALCDRKYPGNTLNSNGFQHFVYLRAFDSLVLLNLLGQTLNVTYHNYINLPTFERR